MVGRAVAQTCTTEMKQDRREREWAAESLQCRSSKAQAIHKRKRQQGRHPRGQNNLLLFVHKGYANGFEKILLLLSFH